MNSTWCTVCCRKVNICDYCLLNSTWTVTQNTWKKKKKKNKRTKRTKTQNADGFKMQTYIQTSTKYLKYKWNFYLLIPFKFPQYGRIKNERFEGGKITLKIPLNASSWALKKNLKGSLNSSPPSLYSLFLPLHLNTVRSLITLKRPFQGPSWIYTTHCLSRGKMLLGIWRVVKPVSFHYKTMRLVLWRG